MFVEYERLLYTGEARLSSFRIDLVCRHKISINLCFTIKYLLKDNTEIENLDGVI